MQLAGELGHDRGRFSESRDGEILALLAELFEGDFAVRPKGLVVEREFDPRLGLRAEGEAADDKFEDNAQVRVVVASLPLLAEERLHFR